MVDILVRNLAPEMMAWLKAEAKRHHRSLSDEAKVIFLRRLWRDGDLSREIAERDLAAIGATLEGE